MTFPLVIDRGVSRYLSTFDFMSFRKTSRTHYHDTEAFEIRAMKLPLNCPGLRVKQKIGLHYLLGWALNFDAMIGSHEWCQKIVNWLDYRSSIKIIYIFLKNYCIDFFQKMTMVALCGRQRVIWLRLCHRNSRLFKRRSLDYLCDERPRKRLSDTFSMYGNLQQCRC